MNRRALLQSILAAPSFALVPVLPEPFPMGKGINMAEAKVVATGSGLEDCRHMSVRYISTTTGMLIMFSQDNGSWRCQKIDKDWNVTSEFSVLPMVPSPS